MFFRNCLPFLRLLEGRIVVFLTPLARYLLSSCCNRADHAPNRQDEEFGEQLQKGLQDCSAVAQSAAEIPEIGMASGHLVVLSTTVKR